MSITIERVKQLLGDLLVVNTELKDALDQAIAANADLARQIAEMKAEKIAELTAKKGKSDEPNNG